MTGENKVQLKVYLNDILQKFQTITNKVTTWQNTPTDTNYPSEKLVKDSLDNKLDKTSTDTGFVKTNGNTTTFGTGATQVATGNHTHGNLTTDGKLGSNSNYFVTTTTNGAITSKQKIGDINTSGQIGSTANLPLITTTSGKITTGTFGTTANTFCQGNDSRLSDARTPTSHTHTESDITNHRTTIISIANTDNTHEDYNPQIDDTITLTITLVDGAGTAVSGEEVTVTCSKGYFTKYNNTSISGTTTVSKTGTTDNYGQFTLTYKCSEWGLVTFSANTKNIQINVTGWKNIAGSSSGTWEILRNQDHAKLILRGWPTSSSAGTSSWNNFGSSDYASNCRPTQYRTFLNAGATLYWRINTDGTIEYRSTSGTVAISTEVWCEIEWAIRDADL